MNSFQNWKLLRETADPEWENMKYVWGSGTKRVDTTLVNKMKLKVHGIIEQYVGDLNDPNIKSFRDMPPHLRDGLAQSLVVATLKAFYADLDSDPTGGTGVLDQRKLGQMQSQQPQQDMTAPAGWKG